MGMFDTIIFDNPIKCELCGTQIESTQTKNFECLMESYYIGDIIQSTTITGIIQEELFCDNFKNHPDYIASLKEIEEKEQAVQTKEDKKEFHVIQFKHQSIFLVLWQQILIGMEETYENAENLLKSFNILQLSDLYRKNYEKKTENARQRQEIIIFGENYFKYLTLDPEEQEKIRNDEKGFKYFSFWHILPYLEDENPFHKFAEELNTKLKTY